MVKNRLLTTSIILFVIFRVYAAKGDLLAAWEFNTGDQSGSEVSATAGTAVNSTGTLMGDANISAGFLALDGSDDYLAFGTNVSDLRGLSAFTISAWLRVADTNKVLRRIVEHDDNFYFFQQNSRYRFVIHGSGGASLTSSTAPEPNVWQHVAATWERNQSAKIYVNGVLEESLNNPTVAMPNNSERLSFGAQRNNSPTPTSTAYYNGDMDDIAIWSRALTEGEIQALAGRNAGGYLNRLSPSLYTNVTINSHLQNLGSTNATLKYILSAPTTETRLYWGVTDGGTTAEQWANCYELGTLAASAVTTNLTDLAPGTIYYYRLQARDTHANEHWSEVAEFFTFVEMPEDLPDLKLWLRADRGVLKDNGSNAAHNDTVFTWEDQSGNNHHAVSVGSSGVLRFEAGNLNSSATIRTTDLRDNTYLSVTNYTPAADDNLSVFLVARASEQIYNGSAIHPVIGAGNIANGKGTFCISATRPDFPDSLGTLGYFGRNYGSEPPYSELAAADSQPNFSPADGHIIALTVDTEANDGKGLFTGYFDGSTKAITPGLTDSPILGPIDIAGTYTDGQRRFAGNISELIIYERVLNEEERNNIGWYLQTKYGLNGIFRKPYTCWLTNHTATAVGKNSARLNAKLLSGDLPATITLYWGSSDGRAEPSAWENSVSVGEITELTTFSKLVSGLIPGQRYYYRFHGMNAYGESWALSTSSFTTWHQEPTDLSGLQLWLRADDKVMTNGGSVVEQWSDNSSNQYSATRIGSADNFIYADDQLNGLPALKVTDIQNGDYLRVADYQVEDNDNLTIFVVAQAEKQTLNVSAIHPLLSSGTPSQGKGTFCISATRPNVVGAEGSLGYFGRGYGSSVPYNELSLSNSVPNFAQGAPHIIALTLDTTANGGLGEFVGYFDGYQRKTIAGVNSNPDNGAVEIGGSFVNNSARFAGRFGDIVIYNRKLSSAECHEVGWYLQKKYAIDGIYANPFLATLSNSTVSAVSETSATLSVEVIGGTLPVEITIHCGAVREQPTSTASVTVDTLGVTNITVTGLLPGAIYYATFSALNEEGEKWGDTTLSFVTDGPPIVTVYAPNAPTFNSAVIEGGIIATSGAPSTATFYWGTSDGGTHAASWQNAIPLGTQDIGELNSLISELEPDHVYYYRLLANNTFGTRWSECLQFTTPYPASCVKPENLVLWLRSDLGVTHSNGLVHAWVDQSQNDSLAKTALAEGINRPLIKANLMNGRAGIVFDGINNYLKINNHETLNLGTGDGKGWTIFTVFQPQKTGSQYILPKGISSSSQTDWRLMLEGSGLIWGTGASSDSNAWFKTVMPNVDNPHVVAATLKQSGEAVGTKVLYIDGQAFPSELYNQKASVNEHPVVIGGSDTQTVNLQGVVAEIVVYSRALSERDINNIGFYLQEKYGVTGSFEYIPPLGSILIIR